METRPKEQHDVQRPPYPQISSASTSVPSSQFSACSAFHSSASVASIQTPNSAAMQSPLGYAQTAPMAQSSAPLPSPLAQQPTNYFGSINAASTAQQAPYSQQRNPSGNQASTYTGQRGDNGGTPETAPFLNNFNLVAEAAKRAQMACLMRDLGDVEI